MNSSEIRSKFLEYFARQGPHGRASSPLVPGNDPTLLFTNSGMVQFKDVFLGQDKRAYARATTSQRCVRAGGKHNDLENVGYTARHHTFFEMLGNFCFGDYFKRDAIRFAWELLTKVYKLPPERLWVTVYHEDDEAYDIWTKEIGVPKERCVRIGDKPGASKYQSDNFWQMADTGPCGPCTEIFCDHGPGIAGGPPGSTDADGDRYVEIWNLVFMQYQPRRKRRRMHAAAQALVDTGMGLERIAAVLQGVHSNYEIDLFQDLIKAAARETGTKDLSSNSLKVIADHIRATALPDRRRRDSRRTKAAATCSGASSAAPSATATSSGRRHRSSTASWTISRARWAPPIPSCAQAKDRVRQVLLQEEERFAETLENGMKVLEGALTREDRMLDGETVFQLYDTFGFPVDLTADIARERGVRVDYAGFEAAMERQRERARAASKFQLGASVEYTGAATEFHGYETLALEGKVVALYRRTACRFRSSGPARRASWCSTARRSTRSRAARSGDSGEIAGVAGTFAVEDTQKIQPAVFGHKGAVKTGRLRVGDKVMAGVDAARRATHHAQPLRDPPDAQGAARGAGRARAAEGLAGGCRAGRASTFRTTRR